MYVTRATICKVCVIHELIYFYIYVNMYVFIYLHIHRYFHVYIGGGCLTRRVLLSATFVSSKNLTQSDISRVRAYIAESEHDRGRGDRKVVSEAE